MDSTPNSNRRPQTRVTGRSPSDAPTENQCSSILRTDHVDQLAAILVPQHERLLLADSLAEESGPGDPAEISPADDALLLAEIDSLQACLRRVERARRDNIVHAASRSAGDTTGGGAADTFRNGLSESAAAGDAAATWEWNEDSDQPARRIGRFKIVRELGRGGLGVVMLAYDPVLKRQVALKIPRPEALLADGLRARFQHEAQAAARLTHPHIVPVHEVGTVGPICFIAAAYVAGPSLADWLKTEARRVTPRMAAELIAELAEAMHFAHGQGVLHRDLKPGNILLVPRFSAEFVASDSSYASPWVPKITDFGLAKLMDLAGDETRTGVIIGTPAYMSPEQASGTRSKIGPAADVYSLGAMLYELLTGRPPFRGESDAETLLQVTSQDPTPPRRTRPEIPIDLETICLHCLEKLPAQRYATAGELAADLRRFLANESTLVRPLTTTQNLARWARRRPAQAALTLVSAAAVLLIVAGGWYHTRQLNNAVHLANNNAALAESNQRLASDHEHRANEELYVAQMRLADRALHDGDLRSAQQLIAPFGPGQELASFRGVEWHVLSARVERAANTGDQNSTTILPHPKIVDTAQFTPDGGLLFTGCQDGHIRVWHAREHVLLWDIPAHSACINHVRFTRDSRQMLTVSCDSTVKLWRLAPAQPPEIVRTLSHVAEAYHADFSPDGSQIAVLCGPRRTSPDKCQSALYVWDVASGERVHFFERESYALQGVGWSPDGRYLVVCDGGRICALRTADWQPHFAKDCAASRIAFRPDNGRLTFLAKDAVYEIDLDAQKEMLLFERYYSGHMAWSADGRYVAIVDQQGIAHLLDAQNAYRPYTFFQHEDVRVAEVAFSPDNSTLVTAGFDHRVCLTKLRPFLSHQPTASVALPEAQDGLHGYDLDGARLTWLEDGFYRRVDLKRAPVRSSAAATDLPPVELEAQISSPATNLLEEPWPRNPMVWRSMSPRGSRAAVINGERRAVVMDLNAGMTFDLPTELTKSTMRPLVFDERPIVCLINDFTVTVLDLPTNRVLFDERIDSDPTAAMSVRLSPNGQFLLIMNTPRSIRLVDLSTAECRTVSTDTSWGVVTASFSPDSKLFSIVVNEAIVGVWETETVCQRQLIRPRQRPLNAAISADNRTMAIGSERELIFWNLDRGQEMTCLHTASPPRSLWFAPDGSRFTWVCETADTANLYCCQTADE